MEKNDKMWQDRLIKFRSDRHKQEWTLAYVKKFIHLFPAIITRKQAEENLYKNIKVEKECDQAFKEYCIGVDTEDRDVYAIRGIFTVHLSHLRQNIIVITIHGIHWML